MPRSRPERYGGGPYSGDETGATVARSGAQWFRLRADTINGSLTYLEHDRIYDPAATNPYWYYFPALASPPIPPMNGEEGPFAFGISNPLTVFLPSSPLNPNQTYLWGLEPFAIQVVPEPGTTSLAALALTAYILARRRRRENSYRR